MSSSSIVVFSLTGSICLTTPTVDSSNFGNATVDEVWTDEILSPFEKYGPSEVGG